MLFRSDEQKAQIESMKRELKTFAYMLAGDLKDLCQTPLTSLTSEQKQQRETWVKAVMNCPADKPVEMIEGLRAVVKGLPEIVLPDDKRFKIGKVKQPTPTEISWNDDLFKTRETLSVAIADMQTLLSLKRAILRAVSQEFHQPKALAQNMDIIRDITNVSNVNKQQAKVAIDSIIEKHMGDPALTVFMARLKEMSDTRLQSDAKERPAFSPTRAK